MGGPGARTVVTLWRAASSRAAIAAMFLDTLIDPPAPEWRLLDESGTVVMGAASGAPDAVHRIVGADYPWRLEVTGGADVQAGVGRWAIPAVLALALVLVWGTAGLMARAIRREAAVSRLQTDFVAAVSHEFRSPLTTVRQIAETLESERVPAANADERRRTYYRLLATEASRLQRLVETLLNFGRMEAGAETYRIQDLDVSALAAHVAAELEPLAAREGVRIDLAGRSPVLIRADEAAISLALRNLIDNAIKYSPGQPVVTVDWTRENGHVALRVADTGPGIPAAEQRAVFQKFVRGDAAIRGNVRGTGVGLAMVQQIATSHGGEVRLTSREGAGSTFTLILPASPTEARS
jgi:signal transduction histidine kinase